MRVSRESEIQSRIKRIRFRSEHRRTCRRMRPATQRRLPDGIVSDGNTAELIPAAFRLVLNHTVVVQIAIAGHG